MSRADGASADRAGVERVGDERPERPERAGEIRRALLAWYAEHRRDLPWRDRGLSRAVDIDAAGGDAGAPHVRDPRSRPDPYAVWISEIMLQQTRVETVGPYFERWLDRFPDVAALAAATLEEVLGSWQGLGYYSRARNLHRAARDVMASGGELPTTRKGWLLLPGVGAYTAGAVASIAFGEPVPAVDGNVKRVLARLDAIDEDPRRAAFAKAVGARAEALAAGVPAMGGDPGDWTQALMELGATVCTPRNPRCEDCPVAAHCAALAQGRVAELPLPTTRAKVREARVWALVVERAEDGRMLIARRPPEGLLGGLWEFVLVPWQARYLEVLVDPAVVAARTLGWAPETISKAALLPPIEHVFTHLRLRLDPLRVDVAGAEAMGVAPTPGGLRDAGIDPDAARLAGVPAAYDQRRWVTRAEIEALPTSVLMNKLLAAYDAARSST